MAGTLAHIDEQVRRQNVETLFLNRFVPAHDSVGVCQIAVVKIRTTRAALLFVEVVGQVLRDEAVEQHAEHISLEVPAIDAATQVVCDAPDGFVQFGAFKISSVAHGAVITLSFRVAG
ncbi:hypothetical protein D3C75_1151250 [compost metagenome]